MTLYKVKFRRTSRGGDQTEQMQFAARSFEQLSVGLRKYIEGRKHSTLFVISVEESGDVSIIE